MSSLRILHLAIDEKFINVAYDCFERNFPGQNSVLVYSSKPLKYATNPCFHKVTPMEVVAPCFAKIMKGYDAIFLHSFAPQWARVLEKASLESNICWIGMGFDYYDLVYKRQEDMLLNLSQKLSEELLSKTTLAKNVKNLIKRILFKGNKRQLLKKVKVFSPVLAEDYELVKQGVGGDRFPKYGDWNYGTLEETFLNNLEGKRVEGKNVLLGNSATIENNHLEAFQLVKGICLDEPRKIIVPLSYGDMDYQDRVLRRGTKLLGSSFFPVTDFMPLANYNSLIQSCSVVIMNHIRQQALGNIITMLYLGAKVFLREECPTYIFLKKENVHVFSIQRLEAGKESIEATLNDTQVEENRKVLFRHWSQKVIDAKTRQLMENLIK